MYIASILHTDGTTLSPLTTAELIQNNLNTFYTTLTSNIIANIGTDTSCCEHGKFNIQKFIPSWVKEEQNITGSISIYDIIQRYYDWLYCDSSDCGGSGYILDDKILDILDLDKTKDSYRNRLHFSYFGEFDESEKVVDVNSLVIDSKLVSEFVKNIKIKFNLKKGTEDSLRLFFNKLFEVETGKINISYPKTQIFRLNGGAFSDPNISFPDPEIQDGTDNNYSGRLNKHIFQDGDKFQEYCYVISTPLETTNYEKFYKRTLHPLGFKVILEKTVSVSLLTTASSQEYIPTIVETPIINNYSSYIIGTTYGNNNTYAIGVSGTTYYGLTYTNGCSLGGIFAAPTYLFPSWSNGMTGYSNFSQIPIIKMYQLNYNINTVLNPNLLVPTAC